jgi:hypothetical protein
VAEAPTQSSASDWYAADKEVERKERKRLSKTLSELDEVATADLEQHVAEAAARNRANGVQDPGELVKTLITNLPPDAKQAILACERARRSGGSKMPLRTIVDENKPQGKFTWRARWYNAMLEVGVPPLFVPAVECNEVNVWKSAIERCFFGYVGCMHACSSFVVRSSFHFIECGCILCLRCA